MATIEKMSVAVTPEMAAMLRQAVESGEYASAGDVMREALSDWKLRRAERAQAVEDLGRLWDAGVGSGPAIDGEESFARLRERIAKGVDRRSAG